MAATDSGEKQNSHFSSLFFFFFNDLDSKTSTVLSYISHVPSVNRNIAVKLQTATKKCEASILPVD